MPVEGTREIVNEKGVNLYLMMEFRAQRFFLFVFFQLAGSCFLAAEIVLGVVSLVCLPPELSAQFVS